MATETEALQADRIVAEPQLASATAPTPDGDPRDPDVRLSRLLDPGTARDLPYGRGNEVVAVRGRIDGTRVVAYCTDATRRGGALGAGMLSPIDYEQRHRDAQLPDGPATLISIAA